MPNPVHDFVYSNAWLMAHGQAVRDWAEGRSGAEQEISEGTFPLAWDSDVYKPPHVLAAQLGISESSVRAIISDLVCSIARTHNVYSTLAAATSTAGALRINYPNGTFTHRSPRKLAARMKRFFP